MPTIVPDTNGSYDPQMCCGTSGFQCRRCRAQRRRMERLYTFQLDANGMPALPPEGTSRKNKARQYKHWLQTQRIRRDLGNGMYCDITSKMILEYWESISPTKHQILNVPRGLKKGRHH